MEKCESFVTAAGAALATAGASTSSQTSSVSSSSAVVASVASPPQSSSAEVSGKGEEYVDGDLATSSCHLDEFREQWRTELHDSSSSSRMNAKEKATHLFLAGSHAEQEGSFYEAVRLYRQAVQLVPDIELQMSDFMNEPECVADILRPISDGGDQNNYTESESEVTDLVSRFQKMMSQEKCLCQAEYEQKMTHMSVLPMEILLYIFKWVVSSELDVRSLEQLSMVCRGFYVCARDPELWRLACFRVWGSHTGNPGKYGSWRNMFVKRTRLRYNGAYISKTTYIRHGEDSFQDHFYRPWHLVEYFRYLRFFPDGVILMLTTPDDPHSALTKLSHRSPRHSAVLVGHYFLRARSVMAILRRPRSSDSLSVYQRCFRRHRINHNGEDDSEQTFHIELQVRDYKHKTNYKLVWSQYAIHTLHKNGNETTCNFELIQNKFPPFWFSRVKSYTAQSESPLS